MTTLPWAAWLPCAGEDGYFQLRKFNLLIRLSPTLLPPPTYPLTNFSLNPHPAFFNYHSVTGGLIPLLGMGYDGDFQE